MKKQFKYTSEFSTGVYLAKYQFLQQTDFSELSKIQNDFDISNCHIYFICKRPRLSLDKDYLKQEADYIELKYYIHIQDKKEKRFLQIAIPKNVEPLAITLDTRFPFSYFELTSKNGKIGPFKLAEFVDRYQQQVEIKEPLLDFEVLYIGQAIGEDGKKTAIDRVLSHSTLQKIYSEVAPDSEIWIMLSNFLEQNHGISDGTVTIPEENNEKDLNRFINFMSASDSNFTEKQKINFTEASLIQMFMPRYNKEFKGTFPSRSHSSYDECYKLDVNGIVVELDTSNWRRWLYSEYLPRNESYYYQSASFQFTTDKERYKMFNNDYL